MRKKNYLKMNWAERICWAYAWAVAVGFLAFEAWLCVSVAVSVLNEVMR